VRYISNRSSGKQGHAIAAAAAAAGADVVLISGPVALADPLGVKTIHVETARDMLRKPRPRCPRIFMARRGGRLAGGGDRSHQKSRRPKTDAFSDTRRKSGYFSGDWAASKDRPAVVVGFAAESEKLEENAYAKLIAKIAI